MVRSRFLLFCIWSYVLWLSPHSAGQNITRKMHLTNRLSGDLPAHWTQRTKMIYPIKQDHICRPDPKDGAVTQVKIRYNDQPQGHELCTCGSRKKYARCCGHQKKEKHKEIVVTFKSDPDISNVYELGFTPEGLFVYVNQSKAIIYSSEIRTIYERQKSPKVINKIFAEGLLPLLTPDNIFQYFDYVFAIDTNTDKLTGISVCAAALAFPHNRLNPSTIKIDASTDKMQIGKCSGIIQLETIFAFTSNEQTPENFAWHLIIDSLKKCNKKCSYALVVDSDLDNLQEYNNKNMPYFMNFYLPDNVSLSYASADSNNKNNSLLNSCIYFCEKNAKSVLEAEKTNLVEFYRSSPASKTVNVNCMYRDNSTIIFADRVQMPLGVGF